MYASFSAREGTKVVAEQLMAASLEVFVTGPDDQSACLQGDPTMYTLFSVWEETRVVAGGQLMAVLL